MESTLHVKLEENMGFVWEFHLRLENIHSHLITQKQQQQKRWGQNSLPKIKTKAMAC